MSEGSTDSNTLFDLAIIGGGITGLGLAVEAARSGFEVILLERSELCSATSGNSLRIIHGGFRYLQSLNLRRVVNSIHARTELLNEFPNLIAPLPCLMPLNAHGLKSRLPVAVANQLFSLLHRRVAGVKAANRIMARSDLEGRVPLLKGEVPYGALFWEDGIITDPKALVTALAGEAIKFGAKIKEHAEVASISRSGNGFSIGIGSENQAYEVRSRVVVNAAGPWIDQVSLLGAVPRRAYAWSKAFNLVLTRKLEGEFAIGKETREPDGSKRLLFLTPRGSKSVLGTGYYPFLGDPTFLKIEESEIADFLASFNRAFKGVKLSLSDISSVEAGLLPLRGVTANPTDLLANGMVYDDLKFLQVITTKYTTFKNQAREILLAASRHLR